MSRLEEIAYNVGISIDGEKALMSSDDYDFLYNYALEQAERANKNAQDLEDMDRQLYSEQQQNKRYREAVEEAIKDLENECLWDALIKLKALDVKTND